MEHLPSFAAGCSLYRSYSQGSTGCGVVYVGVDVVGTVGVCPCERVGVFAQE